MIAQIIYGFIGIIIGFFMTWKSRWFYEMIGEQAWAEKIFGSGRSETAYKMIGIAIIIVSFLIMTGLIKGALIGLFKMFGLG